MRIDTLFTIDDDRSASFGTENNLPSMTQQSDQDECDINIIMAKYGQSGMFPQVTEPPNYGDFSAVTDYRTALDLVERARNAFQEVPAETRKLFHNNPAAYLEFVENPENKDKLKELGFAKTEKIPETTLADIAKILKENTSANTNVSNPAIKSAQGPGAAPGES